MYIRVCITIIVCVGRSQGQVVTTTLQGRIDYIHPFTGKHLQAFPDPLLGNFLVRQRKSRELTQKKRIDLIQSREDTW